MAPSGHPHGGLVACLKGNAVKGRKGYLEECLKAVVRRDIKAISSLFSMDFILFNVPISHMSNKCKYFLVCMYNND